MNSFESLNVQFSNEAPAAYAQLKFGAMQGMLLVFSPRYIPEQVLRPMSYNFSNEMINDLASRGDIRSALEPGYANTRESLLKAILPSSQGIALNTRTLESLWSFILTIDNNQSTRDMRHSLVMPSTRWIGCGYIDEEPVNPSTMSVNQDAVLFFTHGTVMSISETMDAFHGSRAVPMVNHNDDAIGCMLAQMPIDQSNDLYLMSPGDLVNNVQPTGAGEQKELIGQFGSIAVANLQDGSAIVPSTMNTPKSQLLDIGYALSQSLAIDDPNRPMSAHSGPSIDPYDKYRSSFASNVTSSNGAVPTLGLNISRPISMGELKRRYPAMKLEVSRSPATPQFEICPQSNISARNTLNSMIAATVGACAAACCIDDIIFRFSTMMRDCMTPGMGIWEISHLGTIIPADQAQMVSCANQFKLLMERDLFPIIKATAGDFDVTVRHCMSNQTLVDLNLANYSANEGLWETAGKLGGFISPVVGALGNVQHNSNQLHKLVDAFGMKHSGLAQQAESWGDELPIPTFSAFEEPAPTWGPAAGSQVIRNT